MVRHNRKYDLLVNPTGNNFARTLGYANHQEFALPSSVANLNFHYDASDTGSITTGVGDQVTQWDDQTANNNDATQGVGADQPLTNQTTINGLNVISFTAANHHLRVPTDPTVNPTDFDIFLVYRPVTGIFIDSALTSQDVFNNGGFIMIHLLFGAPAQIGFVSDGVPADISQVTSSSKVPSLGQVSMYEFNNDNTAIRCENRINGLLDGSAGLDQCLYPAAREMVINQLLTGSAGLGTISDIAEIVGFGRKLNTIERLGITNYLKLKWGIG